MTPTVAFGFGLVLGVCIGGMVINWVWYHSNEKYLDRERERRREEVVSETHSQGTRVRSTPSDY